MKRFFLLVGIALIGIGILVWAASYFGLFSMNPPSALTSSPNDTTQVPDNSELTYQLNFGSTTILLTRASGGMVSDTFWNTTPKEVSVNGDLTSLYNDADWVKFLYYDTPKSAYYELEPGGNEQLTLVNEQYIQAKIAKVTRNVDDLSQTKTVKTCTGKKITLGALTNIWSVSCTDTTSNIAANSSNTVLDTNTITDCYLPVVGATNSYLAYEVPVLPAGTPMNMCTTIQNMKIKSVSKLSQ